MNRNVVLSIKSPVIEHALRLQCTQQAPPNEIPRIPAGLRIFCQKQLVISRCSRLISTPKATSNKIKYLPLCKARSFIQTSNMPAASPTLNRCGTSSFCSPSAYAFNSADRFMYGLLGTGCGRSRASRSSSGIGKLWCVVEMAPRTAPRTWSKTHVREGI